MVHLFTYEWKNTRRAKRYSLESGSGQFMIDLNSKSDAVYCQGTDPLVVTQPTLVQLKMSVT